MNCARRALLAVLAAALVTGCGGNDMPPAPVTARLFEDPGFVASGDHEMRYGIVPASELPVEVATSYGINRSKDRVVVNVSVLRRQADALPRPIEAEVEGDWQTLVGETQSLVFRPVLEGGAISYIAELPVANRGPITFELRARPPQGVVMTARITREFDTTPR
ncbi:MAG: DUF4426 domain-containing protein [Steroidobacteraceae bacterium]|nr:DUF4426 domain-containing protein [Steroidobacteraceae bacterium]